MGWGGEGVFSFGLGSWVFGLVIISTGGDWVLEGIFRLK